MLNELEQFQKDLLDSVRQMKAGQAARVTEVPRSAPAETRASLTSHPDQRRFLIIRP
jgi:putative transcriptional regulator